MFGHPPPPRGLTPNSVRAPPRAPAGRAPAPPRPARRQVSRVGWTGVPRSVRRALPSAFRRRPHLRPDSAAGAPRHGPSVRGAALTATGGARNAQQDGPQDGRERRPRPPKGALQRVSASARRRDSARAGGVRVEAARPSAEPDAGSCPRPPWPSGTVLPPLERPRFGGSGRWRGRAGTARLLRAQGVPGALEAPALRDCPRRCGRTGLSWTSQTGKLAGRLGQPASALPSRPRLGVAGPAPSAAASRVSGSLPAPTGLSWAGTCPEGPVARKTGALRLSASPGPVLTFSLGGWPQPVRKKIFVKL